MAALGVGAVAGALALGARANPEPSLGLLLGAAAVACTGLVGLSDGPPLLGRPSRCSS